MTKPIKAKGYVREIFVPRTEDYSIYGDEGSTKPKLYIYCGKTCVVRLKTEKSAIKLANYLNSRMQGISDL